MIDIEIRHFHLFCGIGGGAKGFNEGRANVGVYRSKSRCIGGIDVDAQVVKDFTKIAGVQGTMLDLFDRDQYKAFHGTEPPAGWTEAGPADIRRAAGNERPHIVFLSAPCKGFSGLCSPERAATQKYQALNRLTVRGVWLMLEAWSNDPPELVLFENVPLIASRGRKLLDEIVAVLHHFGYAVNETKHDCGELGGLGTTRKRFLLVARHMEKVPPFLHVPRVKGLIGVGDVLGRMPLPGCSVAGPMHRMPRLQWKTWVRLAFVQPGRDWRCLNELAVADGVLRDYLLTPQSHSGVLGVHEWDKPMGTVTGKSRPTNGAFSVADPRHTGTPKHSNEFRIVKWDNYAQAVTGAHGSGQAVADPRTANAEKSFGKYAVTSFDESAGAIISGSTTGQGAFAVADPRTVLRKDASQFMTAGHYGVVPWHKTGYAVTGAASYDNGYWSVADPRRPAPNEHMVARILALDGTYHRPFTTLELAALQSLIEPEEVLELEGMSDQSWRERIGNMVPPGAATAIFEVMARTLMLAWTGNDSVIEQTPVWVRQVAAGLSLPAATLE
jgi:site-specific DNA-cytosine methylase